MKPEITAYFLGVQTGTVMYGVGEPGIGKTRTAESFAEVVGRKYHCLIGSQHLPEDIIGAPKVVERSCLSGSKEHVMEHMKPYWRHDLENAPEGGILHFDELGDCQPAVQAAMLQILGDGITNTWICATGNPVEISTNGHDLAMPTINRMCVIDWPHDFRSWGKGMKKGWDVLKEDFPILPDNWENHVPESTELVLMYLRSNTEHFQAIPTQETENIKPWPSQRSWTIATRLLAASKATGVGEEVEDILMQGCVGEMAGMAFRKYVNDMELPDPEELLANPRLYQPSERGDITIACLKSVVRAVQGDNTPERWLNAWKILEKQSKVATDSVAAVASPLAKHRPNDEDGKPLAIPRAIEKKLKEFVMPTA